MDIDHLHGREFLEHAASSEPWGKRLQLPAERDVQAIGEERDKDVRFDAALFLMEDRPQRQIMRISGPNSDSSDLHCQTDLGLPGELIFLL